MRFFNIKFTILAILLVLVSAQTFYSQTRPRRVQETSDHPQTIQAAETVTRDRQLNHSLPTIDTGKIDSLLNQYLKSCSDTDERCQIRRIKIRSAAIQLVNLIAEDRAATIPSRRDFQVNKYATYHTANFSNPIRRAPLRRKGRTQH